MTTTENTKDLKEWAAAIIAAAANTTKPHYLVGIAGPPASGKSTLAEQLKHELEEQGGQNTCAIVPMDGFHLNNVLLGQMKLRHRKGAVETFDSTGFVRLIERLATEENDTWIPLFDREQDAVIADAQHITQQQKILLVEGNYLFLKQQPWARLTKFFDETHFINPGITILRERLVDRWLKHGYDEQGARDRAFSNDIPNAEYVLANSSLTG